MFPEIKYFTGTVFYLLLISIRRIIYLNVHHHIFFSRAQLEKKLAAKEKEAKESKLRELAQKAREERAGLRLPTGGAGNDEERERDDLRQERHKERSRLRNLDRAAPDRRSKLERNRERDISEQIALGLPARAAQGASGDGLFDSRLFNQSKGLTSGFEDDEGEFYSFYLGLKLS